MKNVTTTANPPLLTRELKLVKRRDREDALQEAWLAQLEGRNATQAVKTYAMRERRHHLRQCTGVLGGGLRHGG